MTTPHATVLALGSLGMVLARSCALPAGRAFLAPWLGRHAQTVRQQWRECGYEAAAKRGTARCALRVERCVVPLLAWVVRLWQGPPLALALEATTWGTPLTVFVGRVVSRGGAIPVAGVVLSATAPQAWRREWWRLLRPVHRAVPRSWTGIVRAARGVDARWLVRRITRLGGHPFGRLHTGGTFRPAGRVHGVPLKTVVPQPGTGIACTGRQRPLPWTRLARWEADDTEPWWSLTALPPAARTAWWSGLWAWLAPGVQIPTRAGWQGQRTPRTTPDRAARLWRAVAVATWWRLSVGGEAAQTIPASTVLDVTARVCRQPRTRRATRLRLVRVLRRGWHLILVALRDQAPLPLGRFVPAPRPAIPVPAEETPALPVLALPQAA